MLLVYIFAVLSVLALYIYAASLSPQQADGATTIADMLSNPDGYQGEKVQCLGIISEKSESYGGCIFRLKDGDYSIYCTAESLFPEHCNGTYVMVTGYVSYEKHQGYWYLDVTNVIEG